MNTAENRYAPLRGRIGAIHPSAVAVQVEVETEFGVISAVVSARELDDLDLAPGVDVTVQIVGHEIILVRI